MRIARTFAETMLFCRLNFPTGNGRLANHSRISIETGIRSARRVAALERGATATRTELQQVADTFHLDLPTLLTAFGAELGD